MVNGLHLHSAFHHLHANPKYCVKPLIHQITHIHSYTTGKQCNIAMTCHETFLSEVVLVS